MPNIKLPEELLQSILKDGAEERGGTQGKAQKQEAWLAGTRGSNPVVAAAIEDDNAPA